MFGFESWSVTFECGDNQDSQAKTKKEEERNMSSQVHEYECERCEANLDGEEFVDACSSGCPQCGHHPISGRDMRDHEQPKQAPEESPDPLFDFMADFKVESFSSGKWGMINEVANQNPELNQLRLKLLDSSELGKMKHKHLIKLIAFLQFAKDQIDDANTGLCQQDELQRANLDGFEAKLNDMKAELSRAGSENCSLRTENRDLKLRNAELEKYNGRNNMVIGEAQNWLAKITRLVTPYGEPAMSDADRRIRQLEDELVRVRAENLAGRKSFIFQELRERQIFALYMNQQITVEQVSLLLGRDTVAEFNDWARYQFAQHQDFHAQLMAAVLDWRKLNDESEVTKEILSAYLDATRMQVSDGEREMVLACRKQNAGLASGFLPLSEDEVHAVCRIRQDKQFKGGPRDLIGLGMDAVNRIKEHDELNQVARHIPPPEFKTV